MIHWYARPDPKRCEAEVRDEFRVHPGQCYSRAKYTIAKAGELHRVCGTHRRQGVQQGWIQVLK